MDLILCSVLLFSTLAFFLSSRLISAKLKRSNDQGKLPPGKMGWPIVGETLEFIKRSRNATLESFFFDRAKKHSQEVFKTSIIGEPTAVLYGAAGNKFLFSNENKVLTTWWPRTIHKIFDTANTGSNLGRGSKTSRKTFADVLKPEFLQNYVGIMDSIAHKQLQDHWDLHKEVKVLPLATTFSFEVACSVFLGVDDPIFMASFAKFFNQIVDGIYSLPIDFPGTRYRGAIKASKVVREELLKIIRQRKMELLERRSSSAFDNFLSHILTTEEEDGQPPTEIQISEYLIVLLLAGHDTIRSTITFIIKYLAELPDVYEKVLEEQREIANGKRAGELLNWEDFKNMKYSWNVACEVLRLIPPLQGNFREAITDFNYAGFFIPKGWKLYWSAIATHKNPEYFPEPERFDPTRFEGNGPIAFSYVPFGGGPHMCPGKGFARVEILVFMYNVVRRFRWEKVYPNERTVLAPLPEPAKGLPIRLYPH